MPIFTRVVKHILRSSLQLVKGAFILVFEILVQPSVFSLGFVDSLTTLILQVSDLRPVAEGFVRFSVVRGSLGVNFDRSNVRELTHSF